MKKCERCGGDDTSWTRDTTTLIGGMTASLCNPCLRDWNQVGMDSPLWEESNMLNALDLHYNSLALAQRPVALADWEDLLRRRAAVDRRYAAMSLEFLSFVAADRGEA